MTEVVVCGPNLNDQSKGQFHVHAPGCADLKNYGPGRKIGGDYPGEKEATMTASSIEDLAMEVYPPEDFEWDPSNEQDLATYVADFHVAPCVKFNQPKEAAVSDQTSTPEQDAAALEAEKAQKAAEKAAEKERKAAEAKAAKEAKAAERQAEKERKAKEREDAKAKRDAERKAKQEAAAAEKAKRAEERANRPKKVALTLSQRRHVVILGTAGKKGVKPHGEQARKPYVYFVEQGLATEKDGVFTATEAGKARAKDIDPVKYAHKLKAAPKPAPEKVEA